MSKITSETVKRFQASDGKVFATAQSAAMHQAGIDFTKGVTEVEADQFKTSDGRTWDDEAQAKAHQAMLDFEPVLKRYIGENAATFAVQGAETRFRSLSAPFLGWLSAQGVDISPALPEAEAEAEGDKPAA